MLIVLCWMFLVRGDVTILTKHTLLDISEMMPIFLLETAHPALSPAYFSASIREFTPQIYSLNIREGIFRRGD